VQDAIEKEATFKQDEIECDRETRDARADGKWGSKIKFKNKTEKHHKSDQKNETSTDDGETGHYNYGTIPSTLSITTIGVARGK
jgi:hypothetical protein